MAHITIVEDINGDTIEYHWYCSDTCAKTDPLYAGWYGAIDPETNEVCRFCGETITGTNPELLA